MIQGTSQKEPVLSISFPPGDPNHPKNWNTDTFKGAIYPARLPEQNKNTHKGDTLFGRINTKGIFVENLRRSVSQIKESVSKSLYDLYNFEVKCASEISLKKGG